MPAGWTTARSAAPNTCGACWPTPRKPTPRSGWLLWVLCLLWSGLLRAWRGAELGSVALPSASTLPLHPVATFMHACTFSTHPLQVHLQEEEALERAHAAVRPPPHLRFCCFL